MVSVTSLLQGLKNQLTPVFLFFAFSIFIHTAFVAYAYKTGLFSNEETFAIPAKPISVSLVKPTPIKPPPPIQPPKPKKIKKHIVTKAPSKKSVPVKPKPVKKIITREPVVIEHIPIPPLSTPIQEPIPFTDPLPNYSPEPPYPRIAKRRGQEGTVVIEISINNNGHVNRTSIFKSSGSSVLDRAALKTIKTWRFPASQFNSLSSYKQKIEFCLDSCR